MDGNFLMVNSSGMDMVIVNAETCKKASPKNMKALRCRCSRLFCDPTAKTYSNHFTISSSEHYIIADGAARTTGFTFLPSISVLLLKLLYDAFSMVLCSPFIF